MAYDKNDPADKKIVADAVKEALEEATTEHEAAIVGLKEKNKELVIKLGKANAGEKGDPAEITKLEGELETAQKQLKDANKALTKANEERDTYKTTSESEAKVSRNLLIDGELTNHLVKANVASEFMPAVKALLASQVDVKTEGDSRKAVVGDKALGDFVTAWSQGDGKHYIKAPNSSGTGAPGGTGIPVTADLSKMPPTARINAARAAQAQTQPATK